MDGSCLGKPPGQYSRASMPSTLALRHPLILVLAAGLACATSSSSPSSGGRGEETVTLTREQAKAASPAPVVSGPPLRFGLLSPISSAEAGKAAKRVAEYFTAALARPVEMVVFTGYEEATEALVAGKVDFAWLTPLAYVRAAQKAAVQPLAGAARKGSVWYRSVIFVKARSRIQALGELPGKRFAYVDRNSASGYLFPRLLLQQAKVNPDTVTSIFSGSHSEVCRAVASGAADVGATFSSDEPPSVADGCAEAMGKQAAAEFRVLATSDRIPNEVVVARPNFDQELASTAVAALATLDQNPVGRGLLSDVFRAEGFVATVPEDFAPLIKLASEK
jgi:phosphonate transport system substrate-binding protein